MASGFGHYNQTWLGPSSSVKALMGQPGGSLQRKAKVKTVLVLSSGTFKICTSILLDSLFPPYGNHSKSIMYLPLHGATAMSTCSDTT